MRLNEIKDTSGQFFTTHEAVKNWLDDMKITGYTINDDLTVDVVGAVNLSKKAFSYLPVRFNKVGGFFDCSANPSLRTLNGAPREVGASFVCYDCNSLKTLEGAPEKVYGRFDCSSNAHLVSLEGAPKHINDDFICNDCPSLKSLEGAPESIDGYLSSERCSSLESLEGLPTRIGTGLYCVNSPVKNVLKALMVKELRIFYCDNADVEDIINEYLPEGNIFECQQELLDKGLEEYAEL